MNTSPEQFMLQHILGLCEGHADALRDALHDMGPLDRVLERYNQLSKADRRLLDQFAYRYTRLQDDMGTRLMPAILKVLGEEVSAMSAIDRFARLEQLGWLPSADAWAELRQIRNQFTHDYPDDTGERLERLQAACAAAGQLLIIMERFEERIRKLLPK